jgi:hypothetical protein
VYPSGCISEQANAKDRCTNSKHKAFLDYGGRGIQFKFASPVAMALWVQENLGLHPELHLDRIDNDGHYEPGNLRYLNSSQSQSNTRKRRLNAAMHAFRQRHPAIKYADSTLRYLLGCRMTDEEIIARFHRKSNKPKGVFGTFSMPDPVIVSLRKDY